MRVSIRTTRSGGTDNLLGPQETGIKETIRQIFAMATGKCFGQMEDGTKANGLMGHNMGQVTPV